MALDFFSMKPGDFGERGAYLAIPLDAHEALFDRLPSTGFELLMRMSEYWEDATFDSGELSALAVEVDAARKLEWLTESDQAIRLLLDRILEVIADAQARSFCVVAVAD